VWRSQQFARNAEQQFTWALDKADERLQRQGFYQPLPEIRMLLAHHFDSTGSKSSAARRYAEAARGFLDVDDLENADSAMRRAAALGDQTTDLARSRIAIEVARSDGDACGAERLASLGGSDRDFVARQRSNCWRIVPSSTRTVRASTRSRHSPSSTALRSFWSVAQTSRLERVMAHCSGRLESRSARSTCDPFPSPNAAQQFASRFREKPHHLRTPRRTTT
jgi:hypothetical protein